MRHVITEMPKSEGTKAYARMVCHGGAYVLLEDHGLYYDVLVDYRLPSKLKYVKVEDELHKLDS